MVLLKIKKQTTELQPYIDKVIEHLSKTALKEELIHAVEKAIRDKTEADVEKLHKKDDFSALKTVYMTNARHIIENLRTDNSINNVNLIEKINTGVITPEKMVHLEPEDMFTERWRTLIEQRHASIDKLTQDPESTTSMFWCNRCHRNKCTYFARQDRSADEPMTIHVTCCFCNKKWRAS